MTGRNIRSREEMRDSRVAQVTLAARGHFGDGARVTLGQRLDGPVQLEFNNNGEPATATADVVRRPVRDAAGNQVIGPNNQPVTESFLTMAYGSGDMRGRVEYRLDASGRPDLQSARFLDAPGEMLPAGHPERGFAERVLTGLVSSGAIHTTPPRVHGGDIGPPSRLPRPPV